MASRSTATARAASGAGTATRSRWTRFRWTSRRCRTRSYSRLGGSERLDLCRVHRQADHAEVRAERRQADLATHSLGAPGAAHRIDDRGLRLEHLVAQRILERLAREPDQAQALEVV